MGEGRNGPGAVQKNGPRGAREETVPDEEGARFLAVAHTLADIAAAAIMPYFRKRNEVVNKAGSSGYDPVTAADRAAEEAIRKELARRFPEHGILGEEFENHHSASPYTWIIDPIDGTRAFVMGYPMWGTLIALAIDGQPSVGIIDQPFTGERYWGDGKVAFGRSREYEGPIRTRPCALLEDAIFSTTTPDMFKEPGEVRRFKALRERARMTRYGGDCYAYAMLARGLVDVIVESSLKPFDIAALVPVIHGAGGRITGWDGAPAIEGSRVVATGDPRLHEKMLEMLA
jgi:myo-inositol-1(or 4)-monophosphatase